MKVNVINLVSYPVHNVNEFVGKYQLIDDTITEYESCKQELLRNNYALENCDTKIMEVIICDEKIRSALIKIMDGRIEVLKNYQENMQKQVELEEEVVAEKPNNKRAIPKQKKPKRNRRKVYQRC